MHENRGSEGKTERNETVSVHNKLIILLRDMVDEMNFIKEINLSPMTTIVFFSLAQDNYDSVIIADKKIKGINREKAEL